MPFALPFAPSYFATADKVTSNDTPVTVHIFPDATSKPGHSLFSDTMMYARLSALAASEDGKRAFFERAGLFVLPSGAAPFESAAVVTPPVPVTIADDPSWDAELIIDMARLSAVLTGAAIFGTRWRLRVDVFMGKASL